MAALRSAYTTRKAELSKPPSSPANEQPADDADAADEDVPPIGADAPNAES